MNSQPDIADWPFAVLSRIYKRQFDEMAPLRRQIYGMLPLRSIRRIIDLGCGTGLVLRELAEITTSELIGLDKDLRALTMAEENLAHAISQGQKIQTRCLDLARCLPPSSSLFISSFFLAQCNEPARFIRRMTKRLTSSGYYVVLSEYDYASIKAEPADTDFLPLMMASYKKSGYQLDLNSAMDGWFGDAGLQRSVGGNIKGRPAWPDEMFLRQQLSNIITREETDRMIGTWRDRGVRVSFVVRWGIYRKV